MPKAKKSILEAVPMLVLLGLPSPEQWEASEWAWCK